VRVLYLHLPRFPVQRKVVETPALVGRPLALWEEVRGQKRVAFASAAALKAGCAAGMTVTAAAALCPELKDFPLDRAAEAAALLSLGEALLRVAPAFQLQPPDGMWLDGSAAALAQGEDGLAGKVEEIARACGYRGRAVAASDLFTARTVARAGPADLRVVAPHESAKALRGLPLSVLEEDAPGAVRALRDLGLSTLGQAAALPAGAVVARLGAEGLRAQRLCRGEDDALFKPTAVPEVMEEGISLDWPAESMEPLLFALKTAFDRLGARLSGRGRAAVRLRLALKLDPKGERLIPLVLARPSASSRLLVDLARHRIADLTLENPVSGVGVRVEESCEDRARQMALGDAPSGDAALEVVLSRLSSALGEEALFSGETLASHRPEAGYRRGGFHPPARERGALGDEAARAFEGRGAGRGEPPAAAELREPGTERDPWDRPPRLFSKPASLEAEVTATGQIRAARLLGRRRKALAVSGPERLCGEWWQGDGYRRDYYRVHFEGVGPVWVFKDGEDGRYYLQGMFD
jgi:protein ImuB